MLCKLNKNDRGNGEVGEIVKGARIVTSRHLAATCCLLLRITISTNKEEGKAF